MSPRSRLIALTLVLLITPLLLGRAARAADSRPPNVVLIIGDDHGWPYSGFMGDPIARTPNLDALAAQGTTFTNAHNPVSVCQPSLRALLAAVHTVQWRRKTEALASVLGRLPRRSEVAHFRTVARELGRRGYRSWEGGKFWEGTFATAGFTHGLATSISPGYFGSVGDQFGREGWSENTALAPLQAFLDEAADDPFFLWVAPMLPHLPYDAPALFRAPYQQLGLSNAEVGYYANVSWLDALIGRLLAELQARGLRDDTLIIYVSDNGFEIDTMVGSGHGKGTLYELGTRTPLIFNWPGNVPAGVIRDDLVSTLDVPATVLDFAGADQLGDGDARSLRSAIASGAPVGRDQIVSELPGGPANNGGFWVRTPQWRYVAAADGPEELYEIALDPFEALDVAALHPGLLEQFRADVSTWRAQMALGEPLLDAAGRLTDPLGAPVAGETLQLKGRTSDGRRLRLRVVSSADGHFLFESVPHGSYALTSKRTTLQYGRTLGNIPLALPLGGLGTYMDVATRMPLPPLQHGSATLQGVVRTAGGEPVAGATVTLRGGAGKVVIIVLSDQEGRFRAENLTAGDYRIVAVSRAPRGRIAARQSIVAASRSTLDLALPR